MVSNTKEIALEQAIQKHLTGFTSEELAGQPQPADPAKFRIGLPHDFDAQYALDVVPINLSSGYGLSASVQATPFVGIGAGYADVLCFGFSDGRWGPYWREEYRGVPLISNIRHQDKPQEGDRWPGGEATQRVTAERYRASSYVFLPGLASDGGLWPPPFGAGCRSRAMASTCRTRASRPRSWRPPSRTTCWSSTSCCPTETGSTSARTSAAAGSRRRS